jgi:DNA-binding transcriptional MocR family regulator
MGEDQVGIQGVWSEGYGNVSKRVMRDKTVSVIAKAIYAYICSYTGPGLTAWPGRKTACEDLGINKDTWTKHMKVLKEKDYIRVTRRTNKDGSFTSNLYTVMSVPCPKSSDTVKTETPRPKSSDTVKSDININTDLLNSTNNNKKKEILKGLSTRKRALSEFRESIKR